MITRLKNKYVIIRIQYIDLLLGKYSIYGILVFNLTILSVKTYHVFEKYPEVN